ncbi:class D beta-lactamase, partial [Mesorhizobium sp. M1E.F.Ca.ET.063.01.1.1]
MRQMDRYPFFIAVILFLLAWMLGLPMRAQSAPLADLHCPLIQDAASGPTLYQD